MNHLVECLVWKPELDKGRENFVENHSICMKLDSDRFLSKNKNQMDLLTLKIDSTGERGSLVYLHQKASKIQS